MYHFSKEKVPYAFAGFLKLKKVLSLGEGIPFFWGWGLTGFWSLAQGYLSALAEPSNPGRASKRVLTLYLKHPR